MLQISALAMGNTSEDHGEDLHWAWTCWCSSTALQRDGSHGEEPQGGQGGLHQAQPPSMITQSSPSHTCRSHTPQELSPEVSQFLSAASPSPHCGSHDFPALRPRGSKCVPPFHSSCCHSRVFSVISDDLDRAASVLI